MSRTGIACQQRSFSDVVYARNSGPSARNARDPITQAYLRRWLIARNPRPALRGPLGDAAVEDGHVVVAVGTQHEPQSRRHAAGLVVVGDHGHAGADASPREHA